MATLRALNIYQEIDFRWWLNRRLRDQHSRDPEVRHRACDFRSIGVPRGESYLQDFEGLFRKISANAQKMLQLGLRDLIKTADVNDFPPEAMADAIALVRALNAEQALDLFIPVIAEGVWGQRHRNLMYDCASVMLSFDRKEEATKLEALLAKAAAKS